MRAEPSRAVLEWRPPSLAASNVGIWQWDIPADRIRGDAILAEMFGLPEAEARRGISMARFSAIFHPDDYAAAKASQKRILDEGGTFIIEHRIVPAPGVVRWVLARGFYERDAAGRVVVGRGIVIDVTASHPDDDTDGTAAASTDTAGIDPVLDRAAELTIDLRRTIEKLSGERRGRIGQMVDALLIELGRQIAASMRAGMRARPRFGWRRRLH